MQWEELELFLSLFYLVARVPVYQKKKGNIHILSFLLQTLAQAKEQLDLK